jgi:hypothetical protein
MKVYLIPLLTLVLIILCASGEKIEVQEEKASRIDEKHISGEYIVTLKEPANNDLLQMLFSQHEIVNIDKITDTVFLIQFNYELPPSEIQTYLDGEYIKAIQPNFRYTIDKDEN